MAAKPKNSKSPLTKTENEMAQAGTMEVEKELFSWKAPARPFKRRGRQFWRTTLVIAAIFCLILFLAEGAMPVLLIVSIIFLFYILSSVEPEEIEYAITNKSIKIAGRRVDLTLFTRFWFSKRYDSKLLVFETLRIPGRLELVINPADEEKIKKVLSGYLAEEEIPPSALDRLANWFSKKLPQ